jgi:Secretion system C-terminal sorting domain/Beta-propeller repeat
MKKYLFILLISFSANSQNFNFQRSWGTYFGDERFLLSDSKIDSQGNLYIVGAIFSQDITTPTFNTPNSFHATYAGGLSDGFIAKFNTLGQLIWASYFGGENNDHISGIDIDAADNIYIIGTTNSLTKIATLGSYQNILAGINDSFIAKFTTNGTLDWCTYYGGILNDGDFSDGFVFDFSKLHISHDQNSSFYVTIATDNENMGTSGTFQPNKDLSSILISKFSNTGTRIWATYYSSNNNYITALAANGNELYVRGKINDCIPLYSNNSYYGTTNGLQPLRLNCRSNFFAKFNNDGQRLWGSYYGNTYNVTNLNSIKIFQDKIYFSGEAINDTTITTPGSFQENSGNVLAPYLVQLNPNGTRNWGTYNGNNFGLPILGYFNQVASNISLDDTGNSYLSGVTILHSNIATAGAYQDSFDSVDVGYVSKFDELGNKQWGTYYGGNNHHNNMIVHPYSSNFYLVGSTTSTIGMTTTNSLQPNLVSIIPDASEPQNIFIAHFEPNALATTNNELEKIELFPNPNKGSFTIKGNVTGLQNLEIVVYDNQGRTIYTKKLNFLEDIITVDLENKLQSGMYFVKIFNSEIEKTIKMMLN